MPKLEKRITFVLCDGTSKNSYGFRTNVGGIKLDRFKANPVMLYAHDSYTLDSVIGRWDNVRVEGNTLLADAVFDVDTEKGKDVAGRVERGFLKGCSMGLHVIKFIEYDDECVAEESELVEASICAVPSDSNALRLYDNNNKVITYEEMKLAFNNPLNNKESMKENEKPEQASRVEELQRQLQERDTKIATLTADIAAMKKANVDSFLSAAVKDGKISETEKESFAKLCEKDFDSVKSIIDARTPKASASLKEMSVQHTPTSSDREGWTYLEWMKKDPKGLQKMKSENPSEFARLQETLK